MVKICTMSNMHILINQTKFTKIDFPYFFFFIPFFLVIIVAFHFKYERNFEVREF